MPFRTPCAIRCFLLSAAALLPLTPAAAAQTSSSSSSSSNTSQAPTVQRPSEHDANPTARPRAAQVEPGGAAVTLEYNEPLFEMASALNVCGYDNDLQHSAAVRTEVRKELNEALAESEDARASRDALCGYLAQHQQTDAALNVGQYVSLALYLSPPPSITPNVDETQLPPQASQVVNVLPLLRRFAEATQLHLIWVRHRPEYEALAARVHGPMEAMILNTNIYLHQPVSSYDGRRFLVLLEPMLSPALTNARIYGTDYIIVTSPDGSASGDPVRMDEIRHIYLHYVVEPLVYSRGSAMERIQPLLRGVSDAPIDFAYKSDVEALITECLVKAIEAHLYTIAEPAPKRPGSNRNRNEEQNYEVAKTLYDRETVAAQGVIVEKDDRAGWVLTTYFYRGLAEMGSKGDGLRDEIAPMIYGIDVDGERRRAERIAFVKDSGSDPLGGRVAAKPRASGPIDFAESDLMKGDVAGAAELADKVMADPSGDHGRAQYVLARIDLMQGQPDKALAGFTNTLKLSQDPRTLAWSHIYMGRLYDNLSPPDRPRALEEYEAALASRDARPDTKLAAENGIKKPFGLPQRARPAPVKDDDKDFDPTGKAQKEAYRPGTPQPNATQPVSPQ